MEATKREKRRGNDDGDGGEEEEASPGFPGFPPEIINQILLRLPMKSIGRSRCVSKLFCSLSSDPKFAKNHFDLTIRNDSMPSVHRKLIFPSIDHSLFSVSFHGYEGIRVLTAVELDSESDRKRIWSEIVGSSNGLVLISSYQDLDPDGDFFLYNPTTKESKRIPDLPESLRGSKSVEGDIDFEMYGFGYDTVNDDYKVLKCVTRNQDHLTVTLYSLKSDSWKKIHCLDYKYERCTSGVYLNGAIHWIFGVSDGENYKQVVAAFDLVTEEFREMSLCVDAEDCNHTSMNLKVGILKGRLFVFYDCNASHDVIWVMNEYGVEISWSRIHICIPYLYMKPICSTKNDEVILMVDNQLVLYNLECHNCMILRISGTFRRTGDMLMATTYVESLVSPNSYRNG